MYETIIIGGGPAAVSAGVYAARKQLKTALFAQQIGGQSVVSDGIENWIGEPLISGPSLAMKLQKHLDSQKENIELHIGKKVDRVTKNGDKTFTVHVGDDAYVTQTVVVCSGGRHRHLNVPGESEFEGRGVAFCATCDAPFFKDKNVAVVGGGNSGLEAVVDLLAYARKVYLIARKNELRGDSVTQKKVIESDKVEILYNTSATKIIGSQMVEKIECTQNDTKEKTTLSVNGVFVEIGSEPNSEIVNDIVSVDQWNNIIVDTHNQETSCAGIFAAGDVTNTLYRQNNIAVGDAIKALLSAYEYVQKNKL